MKTKTKKPKAKIDKSLLYAIKTKRIGKGLEWMPDEVVVKLTGEKAGKLLMTAGWSGVASNDEAWPTARITANLKRIAEEWSEDVSKGWKLEIRSINEVAS